MKIGYIMKQGTPYYEMDRLQIISAKSDILSRVSEYILSLQDVYNKQMYEYSQSYAHYISDGKKDYILTQYAKSFAESETKFDTLQTLYNMLQAYEF